MKKAIIGLSAIALFLFGVLVFADVDTRDGTAITDATNLDGFSSNLDDADGQVIKSSASPITEDTNARGESTLGSNTTNVTISNVVIPNSSNRYTVVSCSTWNEGAERSISSITLDPGGGSETAINDAIVEHHWGPTNFQGLDIYGEKALPNGTFDIQITYDGTAQEINCGTTTYYNVDQTTPYDGAVSAQGDSTGPTDDVTSATNDLAVDSLSYWSGAATAGSGQTETYENFPGGDSMGIVSSYESGAATVTMSYTLATSGTWVIGAFNLNIAP